MPCSMGSISTQKMYIFPKQTAEKRKKWSWNISHDTYTFPVSIVANVYCMFIWTYMYPLHWLSTTSYAYNVVQNECYRYHVVFRTHCMNNMKHDFAILNTFLQNFYEKETWVQRHKCLVVSLVSDDKLHYLHVIIIQ